MEKQQTPVVIIDKKQLTANCKMFNDLFGEDNVFFSVKANNTKEILSIIHKNGINFDVASEYEIALLLSLGVKPDEMVFSAPTKIPAHIEYAYEKGIKVFAADSEMEIEKLSKLAPGSDVVIRIAVDNEGSEWPLIRKFGATHDEAVKLLSYSKMLGLVPAGVAFHVGSQNLNPEAWERALERALAIWNIMRDEYGIDLTILNMGGGFPAQYVKKVPDVKRIHNKIQQKLKLFGENVRLIVEPGRGLVANTGILKTTVVNKARRGGDTWLYLDIGVYNGLQETIEGFEYAIQTEKDGDRRQRYVLCGPSCDSTDKFMEGVLLPATLTLGDVLTFQTAGAYINSYELYNGLKYPEIEIKG